MPTRATGRLPRRATDRVEDVVSWVLLAALLVVAVAAVVVGLAVRDTAARARIESVDRVPATAVLTADAPTVPSPYPTTVRLATPAAWVDAAGRRHTGVVDALEGTPAGTVVPVWLDRSGAVVPAPPTDQEGVIAGVVAGGMVLVGGAVVLGSVWLATRRLTDWRNDLAWEREWARVGPAWRRGDAHPDAGTDRPRRG
jgi:hypothetical protein